jgi:methionyl-tRNA synthetase
MLMVEGAKMSKSRGTFINAREYLDAGLDPEWLRYFYAANLGATASDIDLSLKELKNRVNGELLANVGNLANRALSLLFKNFGGEYRDWSDLPETYGYEGNAEDALAFAFKAYEECDSRIAIQHALGLSTKGNQLMQQEQPWKLISTDKAAAQKWLTLAVAFARIAGRVLAPVVPRYAEQLALQTGSPLDADREVWLRGKIIDPKPLVRKVEDADIQKLASKFVAGPQPAVPAGGRGPEAGGQPSPPLTIEDFSKLDLRAGKVLAAERVPKKDKLLKLTVDLGEPAPRTIVSGVAKSYAPEDLVGKVVAVVANLPPRDFGKGLVSHGMVLYSGGGAREHTAVELPADVAPGSKVK